MAEEVVMEQCEEDRLELFRYLQGEVTFEQYQAWQEMNRKTEGLVVREHASPEKCGRSELEILPLVELTETGKETSANTLSVSQVWDYLESNDNDKDDDYFEDADVSEENVNIIDTPRTTSVLSSLHKLKSAAGSSSEDIGSVAMRVRPEILAEYLTGKLSFEEFYKILNETKKAANSRKSPKKSHIMDDPEDEERPDEEDITMDEKDETWFPEEESNEKPKKKPRKPRRRMHELPKHLLGLMGEANLKLARGEHHEAIKMCMEIIRMCPKAYQPFQTIGMVYEDLGDITKATEFFLLSVHLCQDDYDEWLRVAELLLEQNESKKAIHCYNKAIRYCTSNKKKIELIMQRCSLYEQLGEPNKALAGYTQALQLMGSEADMEEKYLSLARNVCKSYHEMKKTNIAVKILRTMFQTRPTLISAEDVNMLLELYLSLKQYQTCLETLVSYCGVEATLSGGVQWTTDTPLPPETDIASGSRTLVSIRVPDILPVDLRAKLCVSLIYLEYSQLVKEHVNIMMSENIEDIGDLCFEVAEAYMETSLCSEALPLLKILVQSKSFSEAGVWLRYGECLSSLGNLEEAVEAFSRVVERAPTHLGARVSLSALQQQIGRHDEAIRILSPDGTGGDADGVGVDQMLLLHKCHLLLSQNRFDEFITASRSLLFVYFKDIYRPNFMTLVFSYRTPKHRLEALRKYRSMQDDSVFESASKQLDTDSKHNENKISVDELWDLYLKVCDTLLQLGKLEELMEITLLGLTCPAFLGDNARGKEAEFICFTACLMNQSSSFAYNFVKDICLRQPNNIQAWNLFAQTVSKAQDLRHHRFCLRRLLKFPDHIPLGLLNGHNSLQNGTYKHALGEYVSVFRQMPTDPLVNLCIGLCYIHLASQKFACRKHFLVIQAIAFLNSYLELRGECQESYYNLGRAMHQLDLKYAAVYYYKKALDMAPAIQDEDGTFDLRCEIAHNLSLIYIASGSQEYSRMYIEKYLVV